MKYAIVFPGQGSQSVNMLSEMASVYPQIKQTFNEASDVLAYDLWNIIEKNPENKLNQTIYTQPAMLAAGIAVWRVWQSRVSMKPTFLAGHSLGEYSALVAAEAINFQNAIQLVALRGRLMQEAVPAGQGAMAAILGLEDEQVQLVCADASVDGVVEAVNFNSPGQVVIAGDAVEVQRAIELAEKIGARRALLLPVSVPAHSSLMKNASVHLNKALANIAIKKPSLSVLHNIDGKARESVESIIMALTDQLYRPVLWVNTVHALAAQGITHIFELGPGKVLAGLCKRIEKTLNTTSVENPNGLDKAINTIEK